MDIGKLILPRSAAAHPDSSSCRCPMPDINRHGWGDDLQLKLEYALVVVLEQDGKPLQSGLGASQLGFKWRFIDQKTAGFSMSTYPQLTINFPHPRPIGAASPMPARPGSCRSRPQPSLRDSHWMANWAAIYPRTPRRCLGHRFCCVACSVPHAWNAWPRSARTFEPHSPQTLLNLGGRREIGHSLALLFALGRDFGATSRDQQTVLFYLGIPGSAIKANVHA